MAWSAVAEVCPGVDVEEIFAFEFFVGRGVAGHGAVEVAGHAGEGCVEDLGVDVPVPGQQLSSSVEVIVNPV